MSEQVMGYVEKAKKLMDLADNQPFEGFATFQQPDDEGDEWCTQLHIESELWESMGRPDNITITIKPGDLLNGDVEMISGSLVGADDAD